jgi:hypothetical protein
MNAENDLTSIRKQLPHGAVIEIAKRAGVLAPTVSRALMGDKRSPKLPEITIEAAKYLSEFKARETEAAKALNEVLHPETSEQFTNRLNGQREKFGECVSPLL